MMKIELNAMEFYGFHGVHEEEKKLGGQYKVNVHVKLKHTKAIESDDLSDTVDYETIYQLVKNRMQIRSNLVESLAASILEKVFALDDRIQWALVRIEKVAPPIQGHLKNIAVELEQAR